MSFRAKRELLVQVAPRYRAARHGQRSVILDEFIAVTGYDRKYAIRVLLGPIQPPAPIRRPRAAHYGCDVQEALASAWLAANGICAKRLVPFLVELIPTLERHGHLNLTDEVRQRVPTLSSATADRLLRPLRHPHGLTTTKPRNVVACTTTLQVLLGSAVTVPAGCSRSRSRYARSPSGTTSSRAFWRPTWLPTVAAA